MSEPRTMELTQGCFALVDEADFDWLNQWKWYARWAKTTKSFYAVRNERIRTGRQLSASREILPGSTHHRT